MTGWLVGVEIVGVELEGGVVFGGAVHAPVIEGTASAPLPIATKFVPQSAALARSRF